MRRWLSLALLLAACETRLCRDPDVWVEVEYEAPRTTVPPKIDGALDDECWSRAPWSSPFRRSHDNRQPRHDTRAKMTWDDSHLYVAFEVADDQILTPFQKNDDRLYDSEVVEVFIDADSDGATYNEIEVSPANYLFDASFQEYRKMNLAWDSGVRPAVKLDGTLNDPADVDQGWTAELAIPFDRLLAVPRLPPQTGDRWRVNLFRLDHGKQGIQGQALSAVMKGDFHHLPKFATLVFGR